MSYGLRGPGFSAAALEKEPNLSYRLTEYAHSLAEFGSPLWLPYSQGQVLLRTIPGVNDVDATGCYPRFACRRASALSEFDHQELPHLFRGVAHFSREAFSQQLALPGVLLVRAVDERAQNLGMQLWFTADAWLCGAVLDAARYEELSGTFETNCFPAYRAPEMMRQPSTREDLHVSVG